MQLNCCVSDIENETVQRYRNLVFHVLNRRNKASKIVGLNSRHLLKTYRELFAVDFHDRVDQLIRNKLRNFDKRRHKNGRDIAHIVRLKFNHEIDAAFGSQPTNVKTRHSDEAELLGERAVLPDPGIAGLDRFSICRPPGLRLGFLDRLLGPRARHCFHIRPVAI